MFLNAYIICLRFTRKHHREENLCWEISFRKSSVRGSIPKEISVSGSSLGWKVPLPLMTKGERFIRCREHRHGSRGSDDHRGSMSGINSVLNQSVSINVKGGDF
jgi:hypothetical protein